MALPMGLELRNESIKTFFSEETLMDGVQPADAPSYSAWGEWYEQHLCVRVRIIADVSDSERSLAVRWHSGYCNCMIMHGEMV